jgi:hypothetical protein
MPTTHIGQTDYAALVTSLYDKLGTWQAVADACNGKRLHHSRGYYQQVATGRIQKMQTETKAGIERALACPTLALTSNVSKVPRFGLVAEHSLGTAVNQWRNRHDLTWNEWLRKAHELMQERYG